MIEEKIEEDEKTNVTQIVKLLDDKGSKILRMSVIRARMTLGYNFHGSWCIPSDVTKHRSCFSEELKSGYPIRLITLSYLLTEKR